MRDETYEPAEFLNVDLVVDSKLALDPLVAALGSRTTVLYHGKWSRHWRAVFEFALPRGPDAAIRRFARLLDEMPRSAQTAWNGAKRRIFDVGIQAGHVGQPLELELNVATVRHAVALGAGIKITVYAPVPVPQTETQDGRRVEPGPRPPKPVLPQTRSARANTGRAGSSPRRRSRR